MRPLDRKLLRDLHQTRGLLFAIILVLAVGVMCFVTLRSSYENLEVARVRYYRQCRMADFWIELKKAPVAEVARLQQLPQVAQVEPRIQFAATVDLEDSLEPINGRVISLPVHHRPALNDIVLQQGGYFTSRRQNEVILSDRFAREHRLFPGDRVHLLLNNRREELVIVGTAISSEFSYMLGPGALLPDPAGFGVFYVPQTYAEEVYDFAGATNQVVGRWSPGLETDPKRRLQECEELLEDFGVLTAHPLDEQASHQFLKNEIDGLRAFATVMPAIFLIVAALILNVLISRLVRQQRTVIGTLKALGHSDTTILLHVLKMGLLVGVLGAASGSLLGYLLSMAMTVEYAKYFEFPELRSGVYASTHLIGWSASLVCAALGSLQGARQAMRLRPAEAMRPAPPPRGGAILLERWRRLWQSLSAAWRLTLRGVFRSPMRSLVTVFSTTMGAALLIGGFNLYAAQDYLIDFEFFRVNRSDLELAFQDHQSSDAVDEIEQLPGVDWVEAKFDLPCTLMRGPARQKLAIQGIEATARLTVPSDRQGRPIAIPEQGLVIGRQLAKKLGLDVGDSCQLEPSIGPRRRQTVVISQIVDSYIGLVAYADRRYLAHLVEESDVVSRVQLLGSRVPSEEEALYARLRELPQVNSITDRRELIGSLNETLLQSQFVMIFAIVFFAGVIFLGSILNASMINLQERQREVATLLAIGYGRWHVGLLFLRESAVTGCLGCLFGIPVGHLIVVAISLGFQTDLARLPTVMAPWGVLATFVLAVGFIAIAHAVVQRRIHRLNFLEALNVKE